MLGTHIIRPIVGYHDSKIAAQPIDDIQRLKQRLSIDEQTWHLCSTCFFSLSAVLLFLAAAKLYFPEKQPISAGPLGEARSQLRVRGAGRVTAPRAARACLPVRQKEKTKLFIIWKGTSKGVPPAILPLHFKYPKQTFLKVFGGIR